MNVSLTRIAYLPTVTLGRLRVGSLNLATLEEPWRADPDGLGGQRRELPLMESCVPDGSYILRAHNGTKWKNTWALDNPLLGVYQYPNQIPDGQSFGRSSILIHSGNTVDSILGCILVGLRHGRLDNKDCVLESAKALDLLRTAMGPGSHVLDIRPTLGTREAA